jgi:hypothetical protein
MKKLLVVLAVVVLAGCGSLKEYIPSRWDVNQAKVVTDLRQQTINFDCKGDLKSQLKAIESTAQWYRLYSEGKGTNDVVKMGDTLATTAKEFDERLDKGSVSPVYCDLKKKLMIQQADIMARAVQGRF